jgi:hypothetical protein
MPRTVGGEAAAGTREHNRTATAHRRSAGGVVTLMMAPVADGVRARRVRAAGVVAAVAVDGAAEVVVADLAAVVGGREGV